MTDWIQELNQFLGDKGTKKSLHMFSQSDEIKIQEFISEVFKTNLTRAAQFI